MQGPAGPADGTSYDPVGPSTGPSDRFLDFVNGAHLMDHLIRSSGPVTLDLWSADWKLAAGHRIGVRVTDANTDWWLHTPTKQTVNVNGGTITLPSCPPRTRTRRPPAIRARS